MMHIIKKLASVFAFAMVFAVASIDDTAEAQTAGWYNCHPVAIFENPAGGQISVECSNHYTAGVNFISLDQSAYTDAQENRFLSMAQSALLSGRRFRVYYTTTACPGTTNCRFANFWSLYTP